MTSKKTAPPTCAAHGKLPPADRDACDRAIPASHQQQAAFLLRSALCPHSHRRRPRRLAHRHP